MNLIWTGRWALLAAALLLAACGGGGGGGGGGVLPTAASASAPESNTGPAPASVTLSGVASFESVPNINGGLVYSAVTPKPIRGATVEVVGPSATTLATATTNASGAYSFNLPLNTAVFIRVKAQLQQAGSGPAWDVTVRDNTQGDAIYAMESPTFSTGAAATLTRDIKATSGWDGSRYGALRIAGPFALLDTVYTTQAKVLAVAPATVFPVLRIFWSVNNVPAVGNPDLGQIGSTIFTNASDGRAIYVLGKEDVDTDEFDSSVVAHEWGHYYQSAFSRDDTPGGSHSITDRLDRRVAFSEGWGNAWSGIALGRSNYTDSVGASQAQGANIDLRNGGGAGAGWFSEASIESIFWKLNDQVGFKPIHDAMTGPFKSGVPVTSIHAFSAAFGAAAPAGAAALTNLLVAENISAAANDPYGSAETNDGGIVGVAGTLPLYRPALVGGAINTACVSNQDGGDNRLGSYTYLRFNVAAAGSYRVAIVSAAAARPAPDPDFMLYQGGRIASGTGLGTSETGMVQLAAGDAVLAITDFNDSSAATCFDVTIQ